MTSSEPFTVFIDVDDAHIFNFETVYFQTWYGEELVDPEDPSAGHHLDHVLGHQFEDDEKEWVPWPKKSKSCEISYSYTGRVAVVAGLLSHEHGWVGPSGLVR